MESELDSDAWAALGQLTALTHLHIWNASITERTAECSAALGRLTNLQYIAADAWSVAVLSAVSSLTQLTGWGGSWQLSPDGLGPPAGQLRFPNVSAYLEGGGHVPFSIFPSLCTCELRAPISSAALTALSQHCTHLEQLLVSLNVQSYATLLPDDPVTRIGAIRSMTRLVRLIELSCLAGLEASAWASVAAELAKQQLRMVSVYCLSVRGMRVAAVMTFAQVSGLQQLFVQLGSREWTKVAADCMTIFSAFCRIPNVTFAVEEAAHATQARSEVVEMQRLGLPLPKHPKVLDPQS